MSRLAHVALIVPDYDEAIAYYTGTLGFELVEDTPIPAEGKRWVTIRPPRAPAEATCIVLAQAGDARQRAAIGEQAGGRVFLFLATDDFARDHAAFTAAGVHFVEAPRHEPYGTVAVFEDRYGNRWDLLQLKTDGVASRIRHAALVSASRAAGDPAGDAEPSSA